MSDKRADVLRVYECQRTAAGRRGAAGNRAKVKGTGCANVATGRAAAAAGSVPVTTCK